MKVKSESEFAQSCPTLNDPMDYSPPGSSVHEIFQASVLEWGAIAFSRYTLLRKKRIILRGVKNDATIMEHSTERPQKVLKKNYHITQ